PFYQDAGVQLYDAQLNTFTTADIENKVYRCREDAAGSSWIPFGGGANNLGVAFAQRLRNATGRTVYLIITGRSGTSISFWVGSGTSSQLYAAGKTDIQAALALIGR